MAVHLCLLLPLQEAPAFPQLHPPPQARQHFAPAAFLTTPAKGPLCYFLLPSALLSPSDLFTVCKYELVFLFVC